MSWLKRNSLILLIMIALFMGWLTPDWGAKNGYLQSQFFIKAGVILIFFLQGFSLSTKTMIEGLKFWPLHLFTQFWIFIGIPAIALIGLHVFGDTLPGGLKLGIFFLSVLPTTISSAVVLVSHARGNVAGAIFNTVFSNLSAVVILPIWVLWYQTNLTGIAIDGWPIFINLVKLLLLPFFAGHISRPFFPKYERTINRLFRPTSQCIIGFIVYATFANSFRDKIWSSVGSEIALQALIYALVLLILVSGGVMLTARLLFNDSANRIAAFFTGSQKSLAVGIPYSVAFFSMLSDSADPSLKQSIIILPLLFYHPAQILLAGFVLHFQSFFVGASDKKEDSI